MSVVYDASKPEYFYDPGAWNNSTCKMNISECFVDDTTRLYCQFTRFGAYTSPDGDTSADSSQGRYENGEIFLVGSSDGGRTWSQAMNLTNTFTPNCAPGDCASEHWSSMAKYSNDSVNIMYIEDKDAGGMPMWEGTTTCNPVRYLAYECFTPDPHCEIAWETPSAGEYPNWLFIEPPSCIYNTWPDTASFEVVLTNVGNQTLDYSVTSSVGWMVHTGGDSESGTIYAGCSDNKATLRYTVGPIHTIGLYEEHLILTTCEGQVLDSIPITVSVDCRASQCREVLSTACWSAGVWCEARAGTGEWDDPEGNMYWFFEEIPFMYDGGLVLSYVDDSTDTWFSLYEGSDSNVHFMPVGYYLMTGSTTGYDSAASEWRTQDDCVAGTIEYYFPHHVDTCVLAQRVEICNNTDTAIRLHVGEGIDWDVPYGEAEFNNRSGMNAARDMVYQYGPEGTVGENYHAGASLCHDGPGAVVLENDTWVYPNSGYNPAQIGGLLARHTGLQVSHPDSVEDLSAFHVIDRDAELAPDSCTIYCMVKASSLSGLDDFLDLIDKGRQWAVDHELCVPCKSCYCQPGNANGDTIPEDIDDVVYKVMYVFAGGSPPTPYALCSCDVDCSCGCDIDDVVYEIAYIFSDGPAPCTCEEWADSCGQVR